MRYLNLIFVLFFIEIPCVFSQEKQNISDTISLIEITINEDRNQIFSLNKKENLLDSITLISHRQSNLSELLIASSPILIKSYGGGGGLASVSLRGFSANQTVVNWNGFPINSLTTGDADLSMLNVSSINEVNINQGASGALYGSGSLGGSIDLNTRPKWEKHLNILQTNEFGSFSTQKHLLNIQTGNKNIYYQGTASLHKAENNFPFINNFKANSPEEKREHNAHKSWGTTHNIFIKHSSKNFIESGLWYSKKDKDLAGKIGTSINLENQKDESLKSFIRLKRITEKQKFNISSAYLHDFLHYTKKETENSENYSIDSKIHSKRLLNHLEYTRFIGKNTCWDIAANYSFLNGKASTYDIIEHNFSFMSAFKTEINRWNFNFNIRQDIDNKDFAPFLLGAGVKYEILKEYLSININGSNKYRRPTFNERYWVPGGNPDIKPEKGWSIDNGLDFRLEGNSFFKFLNLKTNIFYTKINDWILWTYSKEGDLTVLNYKSVHSRGLESSAKFIFAFSDFKVIPQIKYNFTRTTNTESYNNQLETNKQLPYIPKNSANISTQITYKKFFINYNTSYTGQRYATDTHTGISFMSSFWFSNIYLGLNLEIKKKYPVNFIFKINNIFDKSYESIKGYPMPRRAYFFSFSFGINKI